MGKLTKKDYLNSLLFLIFIIIFWQIYVMIFKVDSYILPAPSSIIQVFVTKGTLLLQHSLVTTTEAVIGLFLAIILGIVVAILLHSLRILRILFIPYISSLQMMPSIAIIPLFATWFGFGLFPKVLIIIIFCSFPIIITLVNSFDTVDKDLLIYMQSLNVSKHQMYKEVYLPLSLSAVFSSIKIATTYALINAIFAEYIGSQYGLGVYLKNVSRSFLTADIFAVIIVVIVITLSLLKIIDIIGKKMTKWV
ncbi:MAG: ABC transporter permease [Mycoplasmatales bacterium]